MNIALTCSIKPNNISGVEEEKFAEFDSPDTISDLASAIEANGHSVEIINVDDSIEDTIKEKRSNIDLIFNVAEGLCGSDREAVVPLICEKLSIPFTASGSQTLINTLNKAKTKEILKKHNVATPNFEVLDKNNSKNGSLSYPLLLKPLLEGSSKGIFNENLVHDDAELAKVTKKIFDTYDQPAIAEEFLRGREFTVSVVGNGNPKVLPIAEIKFDHLPKDMHPMDSYEAKWYYDDPSKGLDPVMCPASIDDELKSKIESLAIRTWNILECKDWTRIDMRLDENDTPHVLEVNALPGFMKDPEHNSRLPKSAYAAGWTYEKLIGEVIQSAVHRFNL